MVILVKIVKIGQIEMSEVSREPIMHSGFFRLKHTYIIAEQKKTLYQRFPMAAIHSKNSQVIMMTWSQSMLGPKGSKPLNKFHLKIVKKI